MDRVELFINLRDCQIVRFHHIGGGKLVAVWLLENAITIALANKSVSIIG